MKVRMKFLGMYRSIIGKELVDVDVETGAKVIDLVRVVSDDISKVEFNRILIDPELEDPRPNNVILVNGREISSLKGVETELRDGDEVIVIPLVHGG
jgi:molybdopterin synthase sulfur carrier subunit